MSKQEIVGLDVVLLKDNLIDALSYLQKSGCVELSTEKSEQKYFKTIDKPESIKIIEDDIKTVKSGISILENYCPEISQKSIINTKDKITYSDFININSKRNFLINLCKKLNSSQIIIKECQEKTASYRGDIQYLERWRNLTVPFIKNKTKHTDLFIGTIDNDYTFDVDYPYINITVNKGNKTDNAVFICHNDNREDFLKRLKEYNFEFADCNSNKIPAYEIESLKQKISENKGITAENISYIKSTKSEYMSLLVLFDYLNSKLELLSNFKNISNSKQTALISCYVNKQLLPQIKNSLIQNYGGCCREYVPDNPPVILKNNGFSSPVETVLETYSLPSENEIDPTPYMSVFYYLFFGMMFSDAGYGLVMSIVCSFIILRFKNITISLRKNLKMFFFCGLSTIFWGLMFGSFFGDSVTVIAQTFFGIDDLVIYGITAPMWFDPVAQPLRLLLLSFLFGIIHLYTGLYLKALMLFKDKKYLDIIYDVLSWILLVSGAVLVLMTTEIFFNLGGFKLSSFFLILGTVMAITGALLILLFSGRGNTAVKRALKGLYGLYGVTNYLSDILSYSRLLALGLATGVIAQVFNKIASMAGNSIFGIILFTVIFILGHSLNIGINALGAYVHTNRLQFVEFFGKFYSGGGKKFKPLSISSESFIITED